MLPRCLARQRPFPLYSLPAHAVVYWYVLRPLGVIFARGGGAGWNDAAVSGTAVPTLLVLPPHAVVRGLGIFLCTFEACRGGWSV